MACAAPNHKICYPLSWGWRQADSDVWKSGCMGCPDMDRRTYTGYRFDDGTSLGRYRRATSKARKPRWLHLHPPRVAFAMVATVRTNRSNKTGALVRAFKSFIAAQSCHQRSWWETTPSSFHQPKTYLASLSD